MTGFLTLLAIYLVSGSGVRAIGRGFTPQPGDGTDREVWRLKAHDVAGLAFMSSSVVEMLLMRLVECLRLKSRRFTCAFAVNR